MIKAPVLENDTERLQTLYNYKVLDTEPENSFDQITELIATIFDTKIALVSLIDTDRQWFKSKFGLDATETHRDISYCAHTICSDDVMVINDARQDKKFKDNPLCVGENKVIFYAGAPLIAPNGHRIGTLCAIDDKPREFGEKQLKILKVLAKNVVNILELNIKNEQLNEVKIQSKKIQSMASAGGWELDLSTNMTKWTEEVYHIHKVPLGTPTSKIDGLSYYAEHEREKLSNLLDKTIKEKINFDSVFEFYDAQGNKKWVRSVGHPELDKDGNVYKVKGTFQDVTSFKIYEEELKDKTSYLDLALNGAGLGIWDWYLEDNSVRFDRRWAEMLGLDVNEIKMELSTWKDRVHPDDLAKCLKDIQAYMNGETKQYVNIHRMKHKEGHWVYILDKGKFSAFDDNGKPTRFTGTHLDISHSESLKYKLSLFFEHSPFGFAFCDMEGKLLEVNKKYEEITGSSFDELKHLSYWDITPKKYESQEADQLESMAKTGKYGPYNKEYIHKKGHLIPVELNGFILEDYNGTKGIWSIIQDVTDRINLERQAQQNAKLASIGELAAGVGHEINNPLTIVNGYLSVIKYKYSQGIQMTPNELMNALDSIQNASDRIAKIVEGLRTFAHVGDNEFRNVDILQAIQSNINLVSPIYDKEGIEISFTNKASDEIGIYGNIGRIQQVFMNLLTNAKDALKNVSVKKINVLTQHKNNVFSISISDTGCGIDDSITEKIYDPFFTTKAVNEGTGIGLSLVHTIIKEHNGEIKCDTTVGEGTTFTIELPSVSLKEEKQETIEEIPNNKLSGSVIIADDEEELRLLLKVLLEDFGLTVQTVENGKQALELYIKNPQFYDLIISDIQMPEMDGVTLLNTLKNDKTVPMPKFILITGGVYIDLKGPNTHCDGTILKPFNDDEVYQLLNELLKK